MPENPETPRSGRDRLRSALLRPSRSQVIVAVLLAVLAFGAITQMRQQEVDAFTGYRDQDLIDVLSGLAGTSQKAEAEISRLEQARADLRSDTSRRQTAVEQAQEEADTLAILAGLVPVTGPGVRVTLTEESGTIDASTLVDMVQELRTAGAEAMQINGQVRLIAQSFFRDIDGGIRVDGQDLRAPYVFDVIGESHNLRGALTFVEGPRTVVERDGGSMDIKDRTSLDIEAVRDPKEPQYAEPDPGQ